MSISAFGWTGRFGGFLTSALRRAASAPASSERSLTQLRVRADKIIDNIPDEKTYLKHLKAFVKMLCENGYVSKVARASDNFDTSVVYNFSDISDDPEVQFFINNGDLSQKFVAAIVGLSQFRGWGTHERVKKSANNKLPDYVLRLHSHNFADHPMGILLSNIKCPAPQKIETDLAR